MSNKEALSQKHQAGSIIDGSYIVEKNYGEGNRVWVIPGNDTHATWTLREEEARVKAEEIGETAYPAITPTGESVKYLTKKQMINNGWI